MRPFGLLLATCLCTVLLYDRLAGRFPAAVLAAAPAAISTAHSSDRPETRLEKLQHYEVLLRLVTVERNELNAMDEGRKPLKAELFNKMVRASLEKQLQPTWDRMWHVDLKWEEGLPADKRQAMIQEEEQRKALINKKYEALKDAIETNEGEFAKAYHKNLEEEPMTKKVRAQEAFVEMLKHERDAAGEALKRN